MGACRLIEKVNHFHLAGSSDTYIGGPSQECDIMLLNPAEASTPASLRSAQFWRNHSLGGEGREYPSVTMAS